MTGSLTFRLTWRFAVLVSLTTLAVLVVGGGLLRHQAMRGLHALHAVEAAELAELLGSDDRLTLAEVSRRIWEEADSDIALYFVQVQNERGTVLFRTPNLGEAILPGALNAEAHAVHRVTGIGDAIVSEFVAGPWRMRVASPLAPVNRLLADYAQVSAVLVGCVALTSVGLGYALSRVTLKPVRAIESTARRIDANNLRERVPLPNTGDELAALAALLNEMFDRLERSFEQVRRFTADASHELKTPLALVRLNAERLRSRVADDAEASGAVDDLLEEIAAMNRIIESLLFIAKAESGALTVRREEVEVRRMLEPFEEDARVLAEDSGRIFTVTRNDEGRASFEPALVRQLLLNVVSNALKATPRGGRVMLESARTERGWSFSVIDEGPGLPGDRLERIFERFVRFDHDGQADLEGTRGHGLGLAICRSIAELHGGTIRAENRRDDCSGLRVVVDIPSGIRP